MGFMRGKANIMNYKRKLFDFLENDANRKYCSPIIKKLLQANLRKRKFVIKIDNTHEKISLAPEEIEEKIQEILEFIVKKALIEGYSTLVVPCMISKYQAPNFYIQDETPREEELWRFLYLLLTGMHGHDYVLNLDNVSDELLSDFRTWLLNKNYVILSSEHSGLNFGELLSSLNIPRAVLLEEFIVSFLLLSCFAKFWKEKQDEMKFAEIQGEIFAKVSDDMTFIVFVLSRQKKKMFIFPRMKEILTRYYEDFFESSESIPSISRFIFSLCIADKDYREKSSKLLNKLLYYMLQGYINGELLSRTIELKDGYELKKKNKRVYGILSASQFFLKL